MERSNLRIDKIDQYKSKKYGKNGDMLNDKDLRNNIIWKIKPRYTVSVKNESVLSLDNRRGETSVKVVREVINGIETSETENLSHSIGVSLPIPFGFGVDLNSQISKTLTQSRKENWKQTVTEYFEVPAGKKYEWKRAVVRYSSEFGEAHLTYYSEDKFLCVNDVC